MPEGAVLEPPLQQVQQVDPPSGDEQEATAEVPSVFSVINRYLVGAADVSPPAEDGSRILRLYSASGNAIVEANLAPPLCEFISGKLVEVEVITQDDEEAEDAGTKE